MFRSVLARRWLRTGPQRPGGQHRHGARGITGATCAAVAAGIAFTTAGLAGAAAPATATTRSLAPPAGAAITSPGSYRVLSAAATQTPAGTWQKLPAAPITKAPVTMVSVWTGREMIIHGIGSRGITFAYRPAARTWVRLADGPQPATVNSADVAVWTGSRMLVIGLTSGSYDPAANTWRQIARPGVSLGGAVTGWTGRQFLAWGGTCCEDTSRDGMAYNPVTSTWRKLPAAPLQPRASASGAWTGKELVVAGGRDFFRKTVFRDAAAYNPSTGTWRKLPPMPSTLTLGGPALWDGKEILFLSSSSARGLAYNPARNSWRLLPAMPLPRFGFAAVWTGHRVLVWGGLAGSNPAWAPPAHGEAYNPAASQWTALPASPLHGRAFLTAVWTGHQMIVWGGHIPQATTDTFFTDGAAYTP